MNYKIIKKIPSDDNFKFHCAPSQNTVLNIHHHRYEIKNILEGIDKRLLLITGPCSAWPQPAVYEYAKLLHLLSQQVKDVIKIVMRVYTQKPRTTKGWVGSIHQPNPFTAPDIEEGFNYSYAMLLRVAELGLPIASEMVFTNYREGFLDLLSWIAIGARSSENQEHRIFASSLNIPVGIKNPTSGCIKTSVCSVISAQHSHTALLNNYQIETYGNPYAHVVLRGGKNGSNYSQDNLESILEDMRINKVKNPSVIIDASHDNSIVNGKKEYQLQPKIVLDNIAKLKLNPELKSLVKGFMVESYIKPGSQKIEQLQPTEIDYGGLSITDPCIGWEETEFFVYEVAKQLRNL